MMEASLDGIGRHHLTSIFPISIFSYKPGVNANPGDPNYDLKKLALESMSKRIYPNWANCNWSQAHETEDDPDTFFGTMGCVDGEEVITYKFNGDVYIECFEYAWGRLSEHFVAEHYLSPANPNLYMNLEGVEIFDTKAGFTNVKRIIRNVSTDWVYLTLSNGQHLLCTTDHPLEIEGRGVVAAADLVCGDVVTVNNMSSIGTATVATVSPLTRSAFSYDVETDSEHFEVSGIYSHNCRTLVGFDRHGMGYTRVGRGNNVPNTIILPKLGIEYGVCLGQRDVPDLDGFWNAFEDTLRLCERTLLERYEIMRRQPTAAAPFMYDNGTIRNADKCEESVEEAIKHNTLAIGYIGVAEMCSALFGRNHAHGEDIHDFAVSVVRRINEFAKEASERNDLNFSCYATPAESLCHTALKSLREQYGTITDVTDHDYITNSHHIPVWEKVSIYDKLRLEAPFCQYPTGGCITYVELESTFVQNTKAVEDIIDYAFNELDIPYLAFNFPIDSCLSCGYQGEFNDNCPVCGSGEIQQLRRVTGYLTTDYRHFNTGKQAEVNDRVKHSAYSDFGGS